MLGKRGFQEESTPQLSTGKAGQLQTPEPSPNPKRPKKATDEVFDGDGNKENIPPFRLEAINVDSLSTSRASRALRRTATEAILPSAGRRGSGELEQYGTRRTVSDEEYLGIRRRASASAIPPSTPTKSADEKALATPPPTPSVSLPLPLSARVKAALRAVSNNGDSTVAGRDTERAAITQFLQAFVAKDGMLADGPTTLFISGPPGTGKTALVNSINQELAKEHSDVGFIFVNCMTVKTIDTLWDRIIDELRSIDGTPGRSKKEKGMKAILNLLKARDSKLYVQVPCPSILCTDSVSSVLVLDELDHIASSPQSLSSLFSLSEKTASSLRVIGIANTHTLTANSASSATDSSKVQTLHFAPYTPLQLQEILRTRLATLYEENAASPSDSNDIKKLLPNPSLVLLSKRIANMTGDVRSLFEVLRGAIDLAVAANGDILGGSIPSTTPQHILAALKAYTPANAKPSSPSAAPTAASSNSEVVNKVRGLDFQPRMALLSLLIASKRLDAGLNISHNLLSSPKKASASPIKRTQSAPVVPSAKVAAGIDTQQLYSFYSTVLDRSDLGAFDPVSRDDFGDLLNVLEGMGLVQLSSSLHATPSPKKRAFGRAASFGSALARNGAGNAGEVKLVEGVWAEEILRGLGVSDSASPSDGDLRNEEVKGLWLAETSRISRDVKTLAAARAANEKNRPLGFADASED